MVATKEAKYTIFNRIIEELKKSGANNLKQARTLCRYLQDGLTTAALCGAGSFYMLILMSCSRIRPEVRKLNGPMCGRVAKLIRCPPGECFIILSCLQSNFLDRLCNWSKSDKTYYSCGGTSSTALSYKPENDSPPGEPRTWTPY